MPEMRQGRAQYAPNVAVGETVIHEFAGTPIPHQLKTAQNAQMLGHVRIACTQNVGDLAGAQLAVKKRVDDRQACRIGQRREKRGGLLIGCAGSERRFCRGDCSGLDRAGLAMLVLG